MMLGISIKPTIGIGDALQYSSVPENYFKAKGEKLIDVSKPWFFDKNPYVIRDVAPSSTFEMWNWPRKYDWPNPRSQDRPTQVYLSNAEIWAALFKVPVTLNRPRLYQFEDYPFEKRELILLQTVGRSHGEMPEHIVKHVIKKYEATGKLFHIGVDNSKSYGLPHLASPTLWKLAELISKARMLICLDSAPAWVAACYPDVIVKKVRTKPVTEEFKDWIPLDQKNVHAHWDDRCHVIHNVSEDDVGFTQSYRRI